MKQFKLLILTIFTSITTACIAVPYRHVSHYHKPYGYEHKRSHDRYGYDKHKHHDNKPHRYGYEKHDKHGHRRH